jgi:uncharacterized protein YdhG (YjbR/CyaY superfamily)
MQAPTSITTPRQYIASLSEERRQIIQTVYNMVRKAAPELKPHIISGMIGFGSYHYKYASGREGDWMIIGLASQKNYVSLYVCCATPQGYLAEVHKDRLGKVSVGKSCIRFKKLEDINLEVAAELVAESAKLYKAGKLFPDGSVVS